MGQALIGLIGVVVGAGLTAWLEALRGLASSRREAVTSARILQADAEAAATRIRDYLATGVPAGAEEELSEFEAAWRGGGQQAMSRWLDAAQWATAREGFAALRGFVGRGGGDRDASQRVSEALDTTGDTLLGFSVEASRSLGQRIRSRARVPSRFAMLPIAIMIFGSVLIVVLALAEDRAPIGWLLLGAIVGAAAAWSMLAGAARGR